MISRKGIGHEPETLRKLVSRFALPLAIAGLFSVSCELEEPTSIWDLPDDPTAEDTPVITSILPIDSSMAGVGEIRIVGENFSSELGANVIFFNDTRAEVISDSETEIVIKTPKVTGDALMVRVARKGGYLLSNAAPYRIIPSVVAHGVLSGSEKAVCLTVDRDENTYASLKTGVVRTIDRLGGAEDFATAFLGAPAMKVGPENDLYILWTFRGNGRVSRFYQDTTFTIKCDTVWNVDSTSYSLDCDTSATVFYDDDTYNNVVGAGFDLDFDSDTILWVGSGTELTSVTPDGSKNSADSYSADVRSVRVFNNYVYVLEGSEAGSQKIWRSPILAGGAVGAREEVVDLGTEETMTGVAVHNFTLSSSSDIYMATDDTTAALAVYYTDTDACERFYPRMIPGPLSYLAWGNGPFLYASFTPAGNATPVIYKIDVRKERAMQFSAPYYGRQY
jgi:hypothetical protein